MAQETNLIDPALRKEFDWLTAAPLAIATVIVTVIIGSAAVWVTLRSISQEHEATRMVATLTATQGQLVATAKVVAEAKPGVELANELAQAMASLRNRVETVQAIEGGLIGGTDGFAEFMRGLARQTPSGLWLTGFTIGATDDDLEVRGRMTNPSNLTEYIRRLKTEPVFRGRSFDALAINRTRDAKETKALEAGADAAKDASLRVADFILKPASAEEIAAAGLRESLKSTRLASTGDSVPRRVGPPGQGFVDPVLTPATDNLGRAAMAELAPGSAAQAKARTVALAKLQDLLPAVRRP